ncbi:MAG: penicillin-binding protein activator [Chiayiivirga sp.]|jgi:outer membrane PBP1 activator LpoA protein|uniref:penicillin-binding protein activator n=1 Tax=Chiayiivirga sp. TaxID=2041042 RepID=UPI0025BC5762|nr:penicillin-binding protein activator [Chiayiivirga sp.]MCI1710664.1 penicillin-binding protein activator [Chiayiivirga sp.]MCI1728495.1 penicillin-binding protein activator [Chiayiivirga sp.]
MLRSALRSVPCLLLAASLLACTGMPSRDAPPPAAAEAERLYADGEFEAAAQRFVDAAGERRSLRDTYHLRAAEAWREQGDLARAAQVLASVTPKKLDADERLRLTLLQAELALKAGKAGDALSRLALSPGTVPSPYRARFHDLRARSFEATKDRFAAASERALLDPLLDAGERGENQRRIQHLLVEVGDDALYQRSAELPVGHPLYVYAGRTLSARGLKLPRPYERGASIGAGNTPRPPADSDGYRPYRQVALLLPLEGPLALAGRAVRDGFFAAYYAESRQRPVVKLYDSHGDAAGAIAAYEKAVAEGAEFVVGPISREGVTALFEQAQLGAPLLALNRAAGAPPPPGSASFALAPEDEGIAAAERMWRQGWLRVIAVAGEDESAQRSLAAFSERLQQRGGSVVASVALPESAPDYGPLIRSALATAGTQAAAPVEGIVDESAAPSVRVAADAIFLSARAAQARLFAPQLRVAGVYDLPIVATSQIAAGGANVRQDRDLDGVQFTEIPWLMSDLPGLPARAPLAEALDSARGAGARLFAFGMDAFRLLGRLDALGADPNQRLDGATGLLWLDGFGQVQRAPGWARYSNGHVQPAADGGLIGDGIEFR